VAKYKHADQHDKDYNVGGNVPLCWHTCYPVVLSTHRITLNYCTGYCFGLKKFLIHLIESIFSRVYFRPCGVTTSFIKFCSFVTMSPPHPHPMTQQSLVGQGLLIVGTSRSHSETPQSVGLLFTSDQPVAETSLPVNTEITRDRFSIPTKFEPAIPTSERQQIHALDRAAYGIGQ
jgi:hypothetical protein